VGWCKPGGDRHCLLDYGACQCIRATLQQQVSLPLERPSDSDVSGVASPRENGERAIECRFRTFVSLGLGQRVSDGLKRFSNVGWVPRHRALLQPQRTLVTRKGSLILPATHEHVAEIPEGRREGGIVGTEPGLLELKGLLSEKPRALGRAMAIQHARVNQKVSGERWLEGPWTKR
jgi:hypothetical protein